MTDLEIKRFLSIKNIKELADILKISESKLKYLLYRLPDDKKYKEFKIVHKNGKERIISSPDYRIKELQRELLPFLSACYKPKKNIYGFVQGRNIKHNAANHTRKRHVINIDIQNFFPTINFGRVRGLFLKEPFNFPQNIATVLAQIICYKGFLPQGAPTSPIISNLICHTLDNQLISLSRQTRVTYTRYADDLTFSTNLREFPHDIASIIEGKLELNPDFEKLIRSNGFNINERKTKLSENFNRQEVTGLIVNKFPNVKRQFVRQIRAMIHAWEKFGYNASNKEYFKKYYSSNNTNKQDKNTFKRVLRGKIEFVKQIKGINDPVFNNLINKTHKLDSKYFKIPENEFDKFITKFQDLKNRRTKKSVQERGLLLEKFLNELFTFFGIEVFDPFRRNNNGEQIDGGLKIGDWYYLVECKWQKKPSDIRDLDSLSGKVNRSGRQTMGLFISINGWSTKVPELLTQNTNKVLILMNGNDIEAVLNSKIGLTKLLNKKIETFNLKSEPYYKPY
jgi:RNA-directed DNA polymerase